MDVVFMYQSDSFFINEYSNSKIFKPIVTSVFKILADNEYCHFCDEDERSHYHKKTIAFIRCTQGQGIIFTKSDKIVIKENEYVFLKFYEIESYKSNSNIWGYKWVNFRADNYDNEFELNRIYHIPMTKNENSAFNILLEHGHQQSKNISYLTSLFLNYFYSVMIENTNDNELPSYYKKQFIDEVCSYIHQKIYYKISVNDIAEFFKISPRRLHQIFIKEKNISPKKYIVKKKMEEGYRLLVQTSAPIYHIADMLCFSSPYHFTNEFKKTFSQSPSEVRKMEHNAIEEPRK